MPLISVSMWEVFGSVELILVADYLFWSVNSNLQFYIFYRGEDHFLFGVIELSWNAVKQGCGSTYVTFASYTGKLFGTEVHQYLTLDLLLCWNISLNACSYEMRKCPSLLPSVALLDIWDWVGGELCICGLWIDLISDSREKLHFLSLKRCQLVALVPCTLILSLVRLSEWTVSACVWPSAVWALLNMVVCCGHHGDSRAISSTECREHWRMCRIVCEATFTAEPQRWSVGKQ